MDYTDEKWRMFLSRERGTVGPSWRRGRKQDMDYTDEKWRMFDPTTTNGSIT